MSFVAKSKSLPLLTSLGLALAGILPAATYAQSANDRSAQNDLDEIVVTATRTAVTADETLAPVEVIDRESIARSQATSLADLLRGRAGINLSNQGGVGKLSTMFLRGSESDHVLVLIDGVRYGSATSGLAALQDLPVALIDRIEIVRGPRSSLYGADAIGGVIQIFTRREQGAPQWRFHVGAGSQQYRDIGVGFGGGSERGWYGIDVADLRTDGINACRGSSTLFAGCFTEQPDRDGYDSRSVSARGGLNLGQSVTLEGQILHVRGHNEYDGDFANNSDITQQTLGATLKWQANEHVAMQFAVGQGQDTSDDFVDAASAGFFDTRRSNASVQADIDIAPRQLLTVGVDWLRDRIDSEPNFDRARRDNRAVFAQYQAEFGAQHVQLALRRDDNDQFGSKSTGTAAWGLNFAEHWRITTSYGTAFKAPTFNELYYPFFSNPLLRPESSKTYEVGLAWRGEHSRLRLDAFSTDVEDLIAFDFATFLPNNLQRARLRGAELRYDTEAWGWDMGASASWLDPENLSTGTNRSNDLPRRARETARVELDRAFGDFRIGVSGITEGARFDDVANTRRLGGFTTLDTRLEYAFARNWSLQARVANLFDKQYETSAFYNQPGREWFLTLRYLPTR